MEIMGFPCPVNFVILYVQNQKQTKISTKNIRGNGYKKKLVKGLKKILFATAVVATAAAVNPKTAEAATAKMDRW